MSSTLNILLHIVWYRIITIKQQRKMTYSSLVGYVYKRNKMIHLALYGFRFGLHF